MAAKTSGGCEEGVWDWGIGLRTRKTLPPTSEPINQLARFLARLKP